MEGKSEWFKILPNLRIGPHYPDADYVIKEAINSIKGVSQPFFLYMHLTDVHGTLTNDLTGISPVSCEAKRFRNDLGLLNPYGRYEQKYNGQGERSDWRAIRFVDKQIVKFLNYLKEIKLDNNIIALTADHGDHRAERYGYGAHYGVSDHLNFYDELTHVPFLIKDNENSGDFLNLLSTIDIGDILKKLTTKERIEEILESRSREYVISEHAMPGVCAITYKPIKIAVRSVRKK